jgi:hypothetical protein
MEPRHGAAEVCPIYRRPRKTFVGAEKAVRCYTVTLIHCLFARFARQTHVAPYPWEICVAISERAGRRFLSRAPGFFRPEAFAPEAEPFSFAAAEQFVFRVAAFRLLERRASSLGPAFLLQGLASGFPVEPFSSRVQRRFHPAERFAVAVERFWFQVPRRVWLVVIDSARLAVPVRRDRTPRVEREFVGRLLGSDVD